MILEITLIIIGSAASIVFLIVLYCAIAAWFKNRIKNWSGWGR